MEGLRFSLPTTLEGSRRVGLTKSILKIAFLLLLSFLVCVSGQKLAGDRCVLDSREAGVCKPFQQCKSAIAQLSQGIQPQICSFVRDSPVVCCKRETPTPTRPRPNKPGSQRPSTNNPYNWPDFNKKPSQSQGGPTKPKPAPSNGVYLESRPGSGISRPKRRISERKCEEYSELVTQRVQGLPLVLEPDPVALNVANCPDSGLHLIVGGEETEPGEFPHMAAIGYRRQGSEGFDWDCGGSLISDSFVLTAAHCVQTRKGSPAVVRLGEWNLRRGVASASVFHPPGQSGIREGESSGDYRVLRIIKHPNYRPPAKYNDIALIQLQSPIRKFTHLVRPACLYNKPTFNTSTGTATGWGRIDFAEDPSDVLLKVTLNIIDGNTCNRLYLADQKTNKLPQGILKTMMCAGELRGGKDTCQGDSGGPIQIRSSSNNCIHYVIGITSFGKLCAAPNAPGVYTRVSSYIPWIESIVWPSG
ncbi:serine protease snake-like [Ischnura elegans]|uniref:serine protease snake-like n=1 Tax=Ischnura elegans TaxID=197161 RepID=UPI001ED8B405|nr:serine protease snake-like [Ischnura elegans]